MGTEGLPQKVVIISDHPGFGPRPEPDDEVRQHLTISADGRAWLSAYNYGQGGGRCGSGRSVIRCIAQAAAAYLLKAVAARFRDRETEAFAADIGGWTMTMTDSEGREFRFKGPLCGDFDAEREELSQLIREVLDIPDLWVLDGNCGADFVDRITVLYHRVLKTSSLGGAGDFVRDYAERLRLDRRSETLEYSSFVGSACAVSRSYYVPGGVSELLDALDADSLFCHIRDVGPEALEEPDGTGDYEITVDFRKGPGRVLKGTYDKDGLPKDWPELMEAVAEFIQYYGVGELLDAAVYRKARPRAGDYIFCSVEFSAYGQRYYYLTPDPTLRVGERVWVPVGSGGHRAVAKIVEIEYFSGEDAPFPLEQVKQIIRRCGDEDSGPPSGAGE